MLTLLLLPLLLAPFTWLLATRLTLEGTFRVEWKPVRPRSVSVTAHRDAVTPHPVAVTPLPPGRVVQAGPETTVTEETPLVLDAATGKRPEDWLATF